MYNRGFSEEQYKKFKFKHDCGRVGLALGLLTVLGGFGYLIYECATHTI